MAITTLIVKIGAKDEEIQKALASVGKQTKSLDADLSKLGDTPVAQAAQKSLELMKATTKAVTAAQQELADRAVNVARGIEVIGGVTKVTSDELNALGRTVTKGVDAFRAMGKEAPDELTKVSAAITQQQAALKATSASWENFVKGFNIEAALANPMGTARNAAMALSESMGGLALGAAAGVAAFAAIGTAAFKLAQNAAAVGANLDDMADKTGMSVPALSRLENAAKVAGTNLNTLTDAVFKVEQRMGEGGAKWDEALKKMGLSTQALTDAGPDRLLETLAAGLAGIQDPAERAATGVALMGKGAKDVIPVLADLDAALRLTNDITPWTTQQAKDAEAFEMQISSLVVHAEAFGAAVGRWLIGPMSLFVDAVVGVGGILVTLDDKLIGIARTVRAVGEAWEFGAATIRKFRGEAEKLPSITGDAAKGLAKWNTSVASMAATVPDLNDALREEEFASKALARDYAELTKVQAAATAEQKRAEAATKQAVATQLAFTDSVKNLTSSTVGAVKGFGAFGALMADLSVQNAKAQEGFRTLVASVNEFHGGITAAGDEMATVTIPMFSTLPNVLAKSTDKIREVRDETEKLSQKQSGIHELAASFAQLAQISGDSFGGLVRDLAQVVGAMDLVEQAADRLSKGGSLADFAIASVGAMDQATKSTSKFKATLGGAATGMKIGAAVAGPYGAVVGAIAGAFVGLIRSAGAAERAINPIREQFVQMHGGLVALDLQAKKAGVTLSAMLNAKNAEQYNKAITDLNAAFQIQADSTAALDAAIQKYGFSIEELGPALQRQELGKQAESIFQDWSLLNAAGISTVAIAGRMSESINAYVKQAVAMGIEVPAAMKPMLQTMIDQGLLTDAAGNKITDLSDSGITFAETMSAGFQKVVDAVTKLAESISGRLTPAIQNIPKIQDQDFTIRAHFDIPDMPRNFAATGGLVTSRGIQHFAAGGSVLPFRRRGSDSVPAMLTPGEIILNEAQQGNVASAMSGGMSTKALERKLDRLTMSIEARDRAMPKLLRDAVLLAG